MIAISKKSFATAAATMLMCAAASAQSVKTTIPLSGLPESVAVNYVTNKVYAAIPSYGGTTDSLVVIDGKTDAVTSTVSIPPIGYEVATDVLNNRVYVAGCYQEANGSQICGVADIDGRTNKVLSLIPITETPGSGIEGIAVDPITCALYIANASDNEIDAIYWGSNKVNAKISLAGATPYGIAVNPFNSTLYVTLGNNQVALINGLTNKVVNTVTTTGASNVTLAVDYLTGNVFVPDNSFGVASVDVIGAKGAPVATVRVGNTPFGVDVDPFTGLAFVTNTQDGTLSVISSATNTVKSTLPVLGTYVAINPFTSKVYISGQSNSLIVVNEK